MRVNRRMTLTGVVLLVLFLSPATARDILFELPATYTDNTPIDCTAYVSTVWYYGPTSDGPWEELGSADNGATKWTGSIPCDNNSVTGLVVDNCWVTGVAVDNSCSFAAVFDNATTYPTNRAVIFDNICYFSTVDNNVGSTPPSDLWVSVALGNTSSNAPAKEVPRRRRLWSPFAVLKGAQ